MLADPAFAGAIQGIPEPGAEREVMGDYYPSAEYLPDRATYEVLHCP